MPIYEYECQDCQHHFDILQKINDDPVLKCPDCHHDTLVRLVSAAGFQLKGTGWYVTDFKNKDNQSSSTSKGSSQVGSPASDSGTDSKVQSETQSKTKTSTE